MGISFAIPIDVAVNVDDQLIQTGHVVRGRIGVDHPGGDRGLRRFLRPRWPRGALVSSVETGGRRKRPASSRGDIILASTASMIDHYGELSC